MEKISLLLRNDVKLSLSSREQGNLVRMTMRNCAITRHPFVISELERNYCKRFDVPPPTIAPRERLRQLVQWRNRVHLFNATCAATGKKILSMVPPDKGHLIYDCSVWHSDEWDPLSYGRDYDFSRPFFEQWYELFQAVPQANLAVVHSSLENSHYTNGITSAKNCYLIFACSYCEDSLFCKSMWRSKSIVDSIYVRDSELCYECSDVLQCYNLSYSSHCVNCSDSYFLSNCIGCKNCYGCINLERKEYHFFNERLSPDEYRTRVAAVDLGKGHVVREQKEIVARFGADFPIRAYFGHSNENSCGNYLNNNKNVNSCYFVSNCEDVEHAIYLDRMKSSIAVGGFGNGSELIYNCVTVGDNAYNIRFSFDCWMGSHDLEYCALCLNGTAHCFGSVGLKKQSYCVLNKEYSKVEYLSLVERIKAHMRSTGEYGQFFPNEMCPYEYNIGETDDYFRLSKAEAIARGLSWRSEEPVAESPSEVVPDSIDDAGPEVLNRNFRCQRTGKPYRITTAELEFYRAQRIPLPTVAPLERIKSRLDFFATPELRADRCDRCQTETKFAVSRGTAPVFCEACFRSSLA